MTKQISPQNQRISQLSSSESQNSPQLRLTDIHHFNDLPLELFFYTITFLDATYILQFHAVCRKWRNALTESQEQFWLHLGAQHFPDAMATRRTYLSQINPPIFYWQQYRISLKHQRKLLEQVIRDFEHHLVTKSSYIRQVCVFLPQLARALCKSYQIDKHFDELPMAEDMEIENDHEPFDADNISSFSRSNIDAPYSYDNLLQLNTREKHGKTSFIISLNESEVSKTLKAMAPNTQKYRQALLELLHKDVRSIFQSWADNYLKDRLHMYLFRPISVHLQRELLSSSGNRLLDNNNDPTVVNNSSSNDNEMASRVPLFVISSRGFTVHNQLLQANGMIYRTAIYCKLLANT